MPLKPINSFIENMPRSGIRRIMDTATADDIFHLEVGQPYFPSPEPAIRAACKAASDRSGIYTRYTPNMGYTTLRKALVKKLEQENGILSSEDRILITPGSNYGIMIVFSVLLNAGDEVLVPDPGYINYASLPPQYGGKVVRYALEESNGFEPEIDAIAEKVTSKTKIIVHNSPSNPTGAVCSEKFVAALMDLACRHNLYVLSDEAYEHIVFEGRHISPGKYDDDGRVISVFTFSKSFAMTGWRLGYVVAGEPIARALEKQQELYVSCAPSISQIAAEAALNDGRPYIGPMVDEYRRRRDIAIHILKQNNLYAYTPHGAFYVLVDITNTEMDSDEFADRLLLEKRVAVAPGATFGRIAGNYIRVSMASDYEVVEEGIRKICEFLKEYRR